MKYEHCDNCHALLVIEVLTGKKYCKFCGWSNFEPENEKLNRKSYIG